ncbi:calcium-activated chloride channel regulator 1-like [Tachypleus tridentatus]|uniref:calcium-activated chloride channel regulator 1-like n=1 Tax=Tachypleus tridentatus TaxID=6853 RepID=UPI003FD27A28
MLRHIIILGILPLFAFHISGFQKWPNLTSDVIIEPWLTLTKSHAAIVNNGFRKVVAAFAYNENATEGWVTVQNFMELARLASKNLYKATRSRSYFQEIHILVPEEWDNPPKDLSLPQEPATFESFDSADFQISTSNNDKLETKTVRALCGNPQGPVEIPSTYLLVLTGQGELEWTRATRSLIQHWAKHRWGVFEEYVEPTLLLAELRMAEAGIPRTGIEPLFILSRMTNGVYPSVCAWPGDVRLYQRILDAGTTYNILTNETCDPKKAFDSSGDLLDRLSCTYRVNSDRANNNSDNVSLMSLVEFSRSDHFCDEDAHSKNAKHPQNILCKASIWKTISSKSVVGDLYNTRNPPRASVDTTPRFKLVRSEIPRIVIVTDISESMKGNNSRTLQSSLKRFINYLAIDRSMIAIVGFNDSAHVFADLTFVAEGRDALSSKLPSATGGRTCISCGINSGLQILERRGGTAGGLLLIFTDGIENEAFNLTNIMTKVSNSGVRVGTFALSCKVDVQLDHLATVSYGKSYIIPSEDAMLLMDEALLDIVNFAQRGEIPHRLWIVSEQVPWNWDHVMGTFPVDPELGKDTMLLFSYFYKLEVSSFKVTSPTSHSVYMLDHARTSSDGIRNHIIYNLSNETGVWKYEIWLKNIEPTPNATLTVTSLPHNHQVKPVQVSVHLFVDETPAGNIAKKLSPRVVIVADVRQGLSPISGACVMAEISRPDGATVYKNLPDNGLGDPDFWSSDGLYSNYFTEFSGGGRYFVKVQVTSVPGRTQVETAFQHDIRWKMKGHFQRVVSVGTFINAIDFNSTEEDRIPPSEIHRLKNVSPPFNDGVITIQFVAPGDDYNVGTAADYEIKYLKTNFPEEIIEEFENIKHNVISINDIIRGSLEPQLAGTVQYISFYLPEGDYYVAIRAIDKAGNKGGVKDAVNVQSVLECPKDEVLFPHPTECSKYLMCSRSLLKPQLMDCPRKLHFNPWKKYCDWPELADCKTYEIPKMKNIKSKSNGFGCSIHAPQRIINKS